MSLIHSPMFADKLNSSFATAAHHTKAASYNGFLSSLSSMPTTRRMRSVSPSSLSSPEFSKTNSKKRSFSDDVTPSSSSLPASFSAKRPKTAPSSPPTLASPYESRSQPEIVADKVVLPSINDALARITSPSQSTRLNPIKTVIPTVSLDYFDTYKPNDENWRYGLLDSIKNSKQIVNPEKYSYLEKHASHKLPSIHELDKTVRPCFDSRVSSKALPTFSERKINFPYESNYTYMNQTYMNDVKRYPEYLELAQSLVSLSMPQYAQKQPKEQAQYQPKEQAHYHEPHGHHHEPHRQHSIHSSPPDSHSSLHYSHMEHRLPERQVQLPPSPQNITYNMEHTHPSSLATPPIRLPGISQIAYVTAGQSHDYHASSPKKEYKSSSQRTKFIPITPPSVKDKTRSELMKSPSRAHAVPRVCVSCGSDQSPCWRPSWSIKEGQLCNSCGLRYKKTGARCLNRECKKIPAKGEWSLMQSKGKTKFDDGHAAYSCLECGSEVEVK